MASKVQEFGGCFDVARPIWDRREGVQVNYQLLESRPFDALMFFTMYAHERPQADPRYPVAHRMAVLRAIGVSDATEANVNEQFANRFRKDKGFPEAVWSEFEKCLKMDDRVPKESYTVGPVRRVLEKLQEAGEPNLVVLLRSKKLKEAYNFLLGIHGGIGHKIAALFLRDVWGYAGPWPNTPESDLYCVQPVDRWVEFWARKCWPAVDWPQNREEVARLIVGRCLADRIDTVAFNKGAWFVGAHFQKLCGFFNIPIAKRLSYTEAVADFDPGIVRQAIAALLSSETSCRTFPV